MEIHRTLQSRHLIKQYLLDNAASQNTYLRASVDWRRALNCAQVTVASFWE